MKHKSLYNRKSSKKHSVEDQNDGTPTLGQIKQSRRQRSINVATKRSGNVVRSESVIPYATKRTFSGYNYTSRVRKQLKPSKYAKKDKAN